MRNNLGGKFPWVLLLGSSHLDFLRPIELLKNHRKHLNKYFHKILMNKSIRFHRFCYFNNIKNIVYFDVFNHFI
jgi:hypothetical protein